MKNFTQKVKARGKIIQISNTIQLLQLKMNEIEKYILTFYFFWSHQPNSIYIYIYISKEYLI